MAINCMLLCKSKDQQVELSLSDGLMDMSSIDFSKCVAVYEDGKYDIHFTCDHYQRADIESIEACVNGEVIGTIVLNRDSDIAFGKVHFTEKILSDQPFLLHYDLIVLSFVISFVDGSLKEYYSDYLLCVSQKPEDNANIQKIIQEIIAFDDSQVEEWLFADEKKGAGNSLYEGKWNKRAYKSLSSYIQLLEQIVQCYRNNYTYFKMQGKHTIKKTNELVPAEKVRSVSYNSFNWLMQNMDQLSNISASKGIQFKGKHYLPYRIITDSSKKSWDIYENRIVISFLHTVLSNAKQVWIEFDNDILNEERIITRIHGSFPKEYRAPIITIKTLQVSFCRILLGKLKESINTLQGIYNQYVTLFDVPISLLNTFPRKTSTFCEIKPYEKVFEIIVLWFQYGEYSLEKERLVLQVKTLDKLFEYYCLLRLLKLLADNGFQKADVEKPAYKYEYVLANDGYYKNEKDVANTYILSNNNVMVTLYYQPVVSAVGFENQLKLYRTTKPYNKPDYYTPDFVLKFTSSGYQEEYAILDSKFSTRNSIKKYHLPEVIQKYSSEIGIASDVCAPRMVWVLQGRVNATENGLWRFHNSPLAVSNRQTTSFGIVSINTTADIKQRFWNEMKNNITALQSRLD